MKFPVPLLSLDRSLWAALGVAIIATIALIVWLFRGPTITVVNDGDYSPQAPLTGLACRHPEQRPVAVMIASDPEARPLTGLAEADMVFEMPVTPSGITRMMAVYQCGPTPLEIGSIRSARQDFIPLAQGLDAIFAHWGGEHDALDQLNSHVIDNLDALVYEGSVFYRKTRIPRPHNGFTTIERLLTQAEKLDYNLTAQIPGYPHLSADSTGRNLNDTVDRITIPWPSNMAVEYRYEPSSNSYARWRGGTPEIDAVTRHQIHASVVVVMKTESSFLRDQYISVRTLGQGDATIYQDGRSIAATWKKTAPSDMLVFTGANGKEIPLIKGPIWVEINAPLPGTTR